MKTTEHNLQLGAARFAQKLAEADIPDDLVRRIPEIRFNGDYDWQDFVNDVEREMDIDIDDLMDNNYTIAWRTRFCVQDEDTYNNNADILCDVFASELHALMEEEERDEE